MFVRVLTVACWAMFVLTVGWMAVSSWNYKLASALFGEKGSRLLTTLLMGAVAGSRGCWCCTTGVPAATRTNWTGAELV